MKLAPVLATALALSLLVNLVLWARVTREAKTSAALATAGRAGEGQAGRAAGAAVVESTTAAGAAGAKRGVVWHRPKTAEEWRALAEDLRAAGFPPQTIRSLIFGAAYEEALAAGRLGKLPFWHQSYDAKPAREEQAELTRLMTATEEAAFGKRDRVPMNPIHRAARYGSLSDEKIATLEKIEQDYGEVYWSQRRDGEGGDALETFEGRARIRLLEEEKERDLAAVLTPEEFEDYERRGSRAARPVLNGVRDIEVTEEEYMALYQMQRNYLASIPRTEGAAELAPYLHDNAAPAEEVRKILTDDRFYSYMEKSDPLYARVAQFSQKRPAITREQTYQLYQLQSAAMLAVAQTAASGRASDPANTPEGRAALAPFAAKLEALLGPELAAAYRRTPQGKLFGSPGRP
ncbi:MAG: hypothetical protein HYV96_08710 [Opitutae bacterium]|nr:hypothetical protein [Opitutae bacterium]